MWREKKKSFLRPRCKIAVKNGRKTYIMTQEKKTLQVAEIYEPWQYATLNF